MRFTVEIRAIEVVSVGLWPARDALKITCSGGLMFRADDNEATRSAYTIGRRIDVTLIPSRTA